MVFKWKSSPGAKLKPWLDPLNLNVNSLDGTYAPCSGTVLECEIAFWNSQTQALTDTINQGESIDFFGGSNLASSNYSWSFDNTGLGGVSVASSTTQSPSGVTFNNSGSFQVQLTVTNSQETCLVDTVIKVLPPCEIKFEVSLQQISTDTINEGESIDFFGLSNLTAPSYDWNFDNTGLGGVSVPSSTNQSPSGVNI